VLCINPLLLSLQTSTAAINIYQFNTPLAIVKPKDLKRLRRYGVLECERQQIQVYCYKNPRKPQRDTARYFTDQFRRPIQQSIILDSLKPKYKYLNLLVL
jgi:hypothetical protein